LDLTAVCRAFSDIPARTPSAKAFVQDLIDGLDTSASDIALKAALAKKLDNTAPLKIEADQIAARRWADQIDELVGAVERIVPSGGRFAIADEEQFRTVIDTDRAALPFPERNGEYAGPPADDASAIREIERLRENAVTHLAIAWPAYWWLDYYSSFNEHLRTTSRLVWNDERVRLFDLAAPPVPHRK
jgi:hypothetical protein